MIKKFTSLFPLWALFISVIAYFYPGYFSPHSSLIVPLLGLIMLGMGVNLSVDDFMLVLKRPYVVLLGTLMQYSLMPLAAWIVSMMLNLPPELMVGVILLGCCPGGTASNVICYLAKGDVALSIVLTSVSTIFAFFITPMLTWVFIGKTVDVDVLGMFISVVKIVLVPVVLGVSINYFFGYRIDGVREVFPAISVAAIVLIIAVIVGINGVHLQQLALPVFVAVVLHNGLGLVGGYGVAKLFKLGEKEARTLAIEVGMQNSGLSVVLAMQHFTAIAALPGAVFSVWHNLMGSFLAGYWSQDEADPDSL